MEHDHTPDAIRARLEAGPKHSYLRDWVYGGIDGAVTTFAVVAGVTGAELASSVIVILGAANLVADGFSMAASNYSGTRTEHDELDRMREVERLHIEQTPEGEREEVRQIFGRKGFEGADLDRAVEIIVADEERWIEFMLQEEFGLPTEVRSPLLAGTSTMTSFLLCGLVPILPYLINAASPFSLSMLLTGLVFFAIGSIKSLWTLTAWWKAGLETFSIGTAAAGLAWVIGYLLKTLA